jgi:hypothetical protein
MTNLKHLLDYLQQVKKEAPLQENFDQINLKPEFLSFKDLFLRNRFVNYTPAKVDELFSQEFGRVKESFTGTLDNVIATLEHKIANIKTLNKL